MHGVAISFRFWDAGLTWMAFDFRGRIIFFRVPNLLFGPCRDVGDNRQSGSTMDELGKLQTVGVEPIAIVTVELGSLRSSLLGLLYKFDCQVERFGNGLQLRKRHILAVFNSANDGSGDAGQPTDFVTGDPACLTGRMDLLRYAGRRRRFSDLFRREVFHGPLPNLLG